MKQLFILVFSMALAPAVAAADLETILQKNFEAHGGSALAQVEAIRVNLHITEPTFEVTGTYIATREGMMRIDIYAGEDRVFAEGLNRRCAWEWNPGQSEEELGNCVGETETEALRHGIELPGNFYTLLDVRERGAEVELFGESKVEWHLRVTLPDGFSRDYFIDQDSHRITRARDHRAFHPGIDDTRVNIETRYEDPQVIDGALRFRRQINVNIDTGEVLGTTQVLAVAHNPGVSEEMFDAGWAVE